MVKKKAAKGSPKAKKATPPLPPFEFTPPTPEELGQVPSKYVKCKINCTALPHLNFEWPAVPTDLTIGLLKEAISKRHGGSVPELVLYRESVQPANKLQNVSDDAKLSDIGIEGIIYGSEPELPSHTFWYDFSAPAVDCPIAFVEPELLPSKYKIPVKEFLRLDQQRKL